MDARTHLTEEETRTFIEKIARFSSHVLEYERQPICQTCSKELFEHYRTKLEVEAKKRMQYRKFLVVQQKHAAASEQKASSTKDIDEDREQAAVCTLSTSF